MRNQTKGADIARLKSEYRSIKNAFRLFFEGWNGYNPVIDIPISRFGVTNLEFSEVDGRTEMMITLERPGILIGKAGSTLDAIQEYLSNHHERPVKILITESKLWS